MQSFGDLSVKLIKKDLTEVEIKLSKDFEEKIEK